MYGLIRKFSQNKYITGFLTILFTITPRPVIYLGCRAAGRVLYLIGGNLRIKVANNMLDILFPKYYGDFSQVIKMTPLYFENLFIALFEIQFYADKLSRNLSDIFQVEGLEHIDRALAEGKGVILYAPHVGNIFYYYYYISNFYPSLVVATAFDKDLINLYMTFHRMGCQGMDYDSTNKRKMFRNIKNHLQLNGVLVLFGDFWRQEFPRVEMFGQSTRLPKGTASWAIDHQVPVIPFHGYRKKGFRHQIVFQEPVHLHHIFEPSQKLEATNYLNRFMEKAIIEQPAQWFYWFNSDQRWEKVGIPNENKDRNQINC